MTTTDMTRAASTAAAITTPEAFAARLSEWERQFNVLTPFTTFSGLGPGCFINAGIYQVNPDPSPEGPREVYAGLPFLKPGEVALAKKGLRKLAEAGGISTRTFEIETGARFFWKVKAEASYLGIDGMKIIREATQEWDLRDGSPRLKGWTPKQVEEGRKFGLRNCEARAINAAIRECGCGIDQKYSVDQLRRPFLVVRVSFRPDMDDPEIKRIVTQNYLGAQAALYSGAGASPVRAIPDDEGVEPEPRRVGAGTAAAASPSGSVPSATTSTGAAAVDPNRPPCEGAVRIAEVKDVKRGTGRTGPWTLWKVIDSNGVEYSTLEDSVAGAARKARDERAWVECITETKGEYTNIVEIAPAGQSPRLPMEGY